MPSSSQGMAALCSMAAAVFLLPALVAGDNSVWTANPFKWDTVGDKLYTFCCNQTGNYSETGLSRIAQTKMMVHGMEEQAMNAPVWQNSEAKVRYAVHTIVIIVVVAHFAMLSIVNGALPAAFITTQR
jgi:hypothetical protein